MSILTSFHLVLGTFSTSCTGSWNVALPSDTSGIHMAQSRCAHFIAVVCLNAPSIFGQNMQPCDCQHASNKADRARTYRKLADRSAAPHQLTSSAQPLSFWYERHSIALLVDCQVTTIAKHYCIGIFAVAIVTDGALCVLLFALASRLSVNCGCATGAWSICRWRSPKAPCRWS